MLFLERLNSLDADSEAVREWESQNPIDRVLSSIQENLQNVFSSRQGMCATRTEDYGLPDVQNILAGDKARMQELRAALQQCVEQFEPRLSSPRVELQPVIHEDGRFRDVTVRIEGVIRVGGRDHLVGYDAVRGKSGEFEIRG